jgi:hypothetical protein
VTNCALWALAEVAGIPIDQMLDKIRQYQDRGWVRFDPDGQLIGGVRMPETAIALLSSLGFRLASYESVGPLVAFGWARWSSRWYRHTLIVKEGRIYDANRPDGMPGEDHPCAAARVRVILRVIDDGAAVGRRWMELGGTGTSDMGCSGVAERHRRARLGFHER